MTLSLMALAPQRARSQDREQSLRFAGDVAFRIEYIANEHFASSPTTADDDHRLRFRVRSRFGLQYSPSVAFVTGLRLATGAAAFPSSEWSSLDDLFNRDVVRLDRAYIRARVSDQLELHLGFDDNPAFRVSEMVWDDDVSPGGVSEILRLRGVELLAGQYMIRELRTARPRNRERAFLLLHGVATGGGTRTRWRVGGYHYYYSRPSALAAALDAGELDAEFRTNRLQPGDPAVYFSEFSTVQMVARVTRGEWRVGVEAAVNLGAARNATIGAAYENRENIAVGGLVRYGDARQPWEWSVEGGFFHVEADAVIAAYTSDDLQQTNVNSIPFWLRVALPGGAGLTWDTYLQRKINVRLASNGGIVHGENATKVRTRVSIQVNF